MTIPRIHRGFTLLEVLVALVIVAFGMGALMATLTAAATSVERLRDKSFAEWVALNRLSEVRLGKAAAAKGKTSGESEMGGQKWQWTQEIDDANFPGMLRIDVRVMRKGENDEEPRELAMAQGFLGLSGTLVKNSGHDVDWTLESAAQDAQQKLQQQQQQQPGQPGQPGQNPRGPGTTPSPAPSPTAPPTAPPSPPPLSNPASTQ